MTSLRIGPVACASVGTLNPGASSLSAAQPPTSARCSISIVRTPFLARWAAQVSPLTPPPITIASYRRIEAEAICAICVICGPSVAFLDDPFGGVLARRAHDATAGMRRRPAHVQAIDRRRVARPAGNRAQEEQLLERQFTLEDVAFGQTEHALDVKRRQHLAM